MTDTLRVILEVGPKRRVVAGAADWPGLDRWGTTEDQAMTRLMDYVARYAPIAERAGLSGELAAAGPLEVVERVTGTSSTDFWGIAHVPSQLEHEPITPEDLERRLALLRAAWGHFDGVAARVPAELLPTGRGGGRSRDQVIRHVHNTEPHNWSRKVEVRTDPETLVTPAGLAAHRSAYVDAIRTYHGEGRMARTSPLPFLIRRTAQHLTDHAWELEDRDPSAP